MDDEALLMLLGAVVLLWWRDGDDLHELAEFLGVPVDEVMARRPLRIDAWRRKDGDAGGGDEY